MLYNVLNVEKLSIINLVIHVWSGLFIMFYHRHVTAPGRFRGFVAFIFSGIDLCTVRLCVFK